MTERGSGNDCVKVDAVIRRVVTAPVRVDRSLGLTVVGSPVDSGHGEGLYLRPSAVPHGRRHEDGTGQPRRPGTTYRHGRDRRHRLLNRSPIQLSDRAFISRVPFAVHPRAAICAGVSMCSISSRILSTLRRVACNMSINVERFCRSGELAYAARFSSVNKPTSRARL